MTHDDDRLPDALRNAARDYNTPPPLAPADLDDMWSVIESRAFADSQRTPDRAYWATIRRVLPIAAVLLVGVAIGRFSAGSGASPTVPTARVASSDSSMLQEPYQSTTSRYLGQTAALLAALPAEVRAGAADDALHGRAHDLLLTTRMLLDSPAASDPRISTLLDDLELVLAQIVRLQTDDGRSELELIRQALEQRDVLPRLRTAVANISADD
ncbi:MAG: hypothetical protein WD801_07515 [Gemmatimonadaceae bacterium]